MPSKLRSLVHIQKPDINVSFTSKKKTYTTLDRIEGVITITAPVDTHFDSVDIEFLGTSRTYVERLTTSAAASGRSEAFHQFLKLLQPFCESHYPEDKILKAGQAYDFPFVFAVPQQLLLRVCQHGVYNAAVRDAHYLLPPTFGDKDLASSTGGLDDMAPEMASVRYGIFVKISELKARGDESYHSTLASKAKRVRVIPSIEEQPPLDVHKEDGEYVMRKVKTMRKGLFKGKLGSLVMEALQTQSLRMRSYSNPDSRITTMATVMLRFDPLDDKSLPPRLGSLNNKLKVTTYFASTARHTFPTKNASLLDLSQGLHNEQLNLSSRCVANVEWTKHDPSKPQTIERRDSATSTLSLGTGITPEPSEGYKGGAYYTARLLVPVTLPANKAFVPTFHSCLISRIYTLKLDLSIQSSGIGPSLELKLPVQISSEGLEGDEFEQQDSVDSTNGAEVNPEDVSTFFEARTVHIPSEGFVGRSRIGSQAPANDGPPGYSSLAPATTAYMTNRRAMSVPVY